MVMMDCKAKGVVSLKPIFHRKSADKLRGRSGSPAVHEPADVTDDQRSTGDNYLDELTSPKHASVEFVSVSLHSSSLRRFDADADVEPASLVAVHGLNPGWKESHGQDTWTKNNVLWLRHPDFLPKALPHARVLLYGYNSKVAFDTTTAGVGDIARDLLNRLKSARESSPDRPIVFLCHSLGGIVVKQALIRASQGTAYATIHHVTRGIAFFGTPHRGGNHADFGSIIASIVKSITGNVKNDLMETLQQNSTNAQNIQESFEQQAQNYHIVSFYETKPFNKHLGLIVDKASAKLGLPDSVEILVGVAENHSNICKFDDPRDGNYKLVIGEMTNLVQVAMSASDRLSVPSILVQDSYTTKRRPSATSFRSDDSLSEDSNSSSKVHFRMPTWSNAGLNYDSSKEKTRESSRERWYTSTPTLPVVIMPYNENPHFVGREEIFDNVKRTLQSTSRGQKRVALYGLGGVGKSQIAIKYALWYRRNFPDHSLFWIHSGTIERFRQAMLEIGTKCRVPDSNDLVQNRLTLIRDWLQREIGHCWLMIIDNADDPNMFSENDEADSTRAVADVSRYIPDCEQGSILVTTRDLKAGRSLTKGYAPIRVERLLVNESRAMLRGKLEKTAVGSQQEDEDVDRLATALDHLPLAIVQAASFIKENSMNIIDYLKLIQEDSSATQVLKHSFEEDERGRDPEIPNAVYATWMLSLEQIQKAHPNAAKLLFLMACYEQSKIPVSLLKPFVGGSSINLTKVAGVLLRFSLIGSGSENSYNMHRLMQLTVRQWLTSLGSEQSYLREALLLLSNNFPNGEHDTFDTCETFEPHAIKIIQIVSASGDEVPARAKLQTNLAWYYFKCNRWNEAEKMGRDACESWKQANGSKHRDTFQAKANLARILKEEGKYKEVETISREVLEGTKSLLGSKDQQTLEAYYFIAIVYQGLGKLSLAEKAVRKALSGREKILEPTHPDIYRSQRRLAVILELEGKYDAAETLINSALVGHKARVGPTDQETLNMQYRLAFIQGAQGLYAAAEERVRETFVVQTSVYGYSNLDTRKMQYYLAVCLIRQSKLEEAESHILDLLQYIKDQHRFDADHRYILYLKFALGCIRTAQDRHVEAVSLYQTAWEGVERSMPGHPDSLEFHSAHAAAVLKLGPIVHAEESYNTQHGIHNALEKKLGPDHPVTLTSLLRLSEALTAEKDIKKALKIAKRVRERREKLLKSKHPDTVAAAAWVDLLEERKKQKVYEDVQTIADIMTRKDTGRRLG